MSYLIEIEVPIFQSYVCVCCLAQNVSFVNLESCKHARNINVFFKLNCPPSLRMLLCQQCHRILQKFAVFKQQVEENIRLFENHDPIKEPNRKLLNLKCSPVEITTILNFQMTEMIIKSKNDIIGMNILTNIFSDDTSANDDFHLIDNENDATVKDEDVKEENVEELEVIVPLPAREDIAMNEPVIEKESPKSIESKVTAIDDGKIRMVTLDLEEFHQEKEMERHSKTTFQNLPFRCEYCIVGFEYEVNLKEHNKKHVKRKGHFQCKLCNSYLSTEGSYKEHCKRHLRRYECSVCLKRYSTFHSAVTHYKKYHGNIETFYECSDCDFTTDSHRKYRYHRTTHKEKIKCKQCEKSFVNNSALKNHMLTQHTSHKFACKLCDKTYTSKSGLVNHETSVHKQEGEYCIDCQTYYKTKLIYQSHLKTHSRHVTDSDLKFACEQCDGKFLTRAALKHHVNRIHLDLEKHPCDKCNKIFYTARNLRRHVNMVHDKQPKVKNKICDHCGKCFSSMSILRTHVRTHTGERPLRCPHAHCAASFAHPAALYNHTKLLHKRQQDTTK